MRILASILAVACTFFLVSCASTPASLKEAKVGVLYLCGCGADCQCVKIAVKSGKCGCGKEMVAVHPLKLEGDMVLACSCSGDCKCAFDAKDPAKCGCGKPIRKVALKGSGLYYCACGGTCCVTISDKPGMCKCGKDLKKAS